MDMGRDQRERDSEVALLMMMATYDDDVGKENEMWS